MMSKNSKLSPSLSVQRKLSAHTKMQNCLGQQQQQQGGGRGTLSRDQGLRQGSRTEPGCVSISDPDLKDGTQPAGAEYLNSRCILFTYFQGDIGDEVDEHFSRALSQTSTFNRETKPTRMTQPSVSSNSGLWKGERSITYKDVYIMVLIREILHKLMNLIISTVILKNMQQSFKCVSCVGCRWCVSS